MLRMRTLLLYHQIWIFSVFVVLNWTDKKLGLSIQHITWNRRSELLTIRRSDCIIKLWIKRSVNLMFYDWSRQILFEVWLPIEALISVYSSTDLLSAAKLSRFKTRLLSILLYKHMCGSVTLFVNESQGKRINKANVDLIY